jgi:hypothetical protein
MLFSSFFSFVLLLSWHYIYGNLFQNDYSSHYQFLFLFNPSLQVMVTDDGKCSSMKLLPGLPPLHYTTMISFCKFWDKQVTQLFSFFFYCLHDCNKCFSLLHHQNVMIFVKTPNLVAFCCPSIFGNQISWAKSVMIMFIN